MKLAAGTPAGLSLTVCVVLVSVVSQAFSKKKTDDRKEWLTNFMEDRRQRRMHGLPEVCGSAALRR